jgi:hypothetical protein
MDTIAPTRKSRGIVVLIVFLILYVDSYLVLSRWGAMEASRYQSPAFYYPPYCPFDDTERFRRWHEFCLFVYFPLQVVDTRLGHGMGAEQCCGFRLGK